MKRAHDVLRCVAEEEEEIDDSASRYKVKDRLFGECVWVAHVKQLEDLRVRIEKEDA